MIVDLVTSGSLSLSPNRLCFCQCRPNLWWPAILFHDLEEFQHAVNDVVHDNQDWQTKNKIALHVMDAALAANSDDGSPSTAAPRRVVMFLGKPLHEFTLVADRMYRDFHCSLQSLLAQRAFQPHLWSTRQEHLDFHVGADQAHQFFLIPVLPVVLVGLTRPNACGNNKTAQCNGGLP